MNELKWDLSITISAIIAVAAVISPILTAIINNAHQTKMKKLELKQEHYEKSVTYQINIFENYLRKAGKHIGSKFRSLEASQEYTNAYLVALLYAPKELQDSMKNANDCIENSDVASATFLFEKITPKIKRHIDTL
ncbi:MAG: hypothetical protein NC213_08005 [Acetobacter sp.]|nr:hypothetical protein [Bacteroides sp.]MCM1341672.1 hypothetical protein [Acetobacter sp.]MCM1434279.1 hypothetical protein [Clostridiales bacterium]